MNDLDLFATAGDGLDPSHFGIDKHGRAYVVASVFAKAMGYRDAANALRILDDAEKGTHVVSTPGGDQRVSVIFEDGIWELIFRSTLPSARSIKARVKAILRELRETGVVDTRPPLTELEMARKYVAALELVAELEPAAQAWDELVDAGDTLDVAAAAKKLLENGVVIGRTRLYSYMREIGWVYLHGTQPKQSAVDAGWLTVDWGKQYVNAKTGDREQGSAKSRVTAKGLRELQRRLSLPPVGEAS